MKKIIALILVLCMTLGMIVSVSAANPFIKRLSLARLIRGMFASDDIDYGIGEVKDDILTVYVAPNGKKNADGTAKNPYATIEAARDAVRGVDKTDLDGINVVLTAGEYKIGETIVLTAEDSGTKNCPITYIANGNAVLCGGYSFDSTAFTKAEGTDMMQYFPAEVRDSLVMIDLKKYDFTAEQIATLLSTKSGSYQSKAPVIAVNGKNMTMARYPNDEWIAMEHGQFYDSHGNPTQYTDNDRSIPKDLQASTTIVEYGDEHFETVTSWHSIEDAFVEGRFTHLWVHDNSEIISVDTETDKVTVPYVGAYVPNDGGLLYFYNIPEELDAPGEYYVDRDAILYYYPEEGFEDAHFTIASLDSNMIEVNAEYITFDGLTFESGRKAAIYSSNVSNFTVQNCIIRDFKFGIDIKGGYNNYIYSNEIYSIGDKAIGIEGGDRATLAKSNSTVCNNYIHDWGYATVIGYAITNSGCGVTVCHNECAVSNTLAMDSNGPLHLVEYNYIHDVATFFSDGGAIGDGGSLGYGTVFRYNLIENAGTADYPAVTQLGVQAFTVDCDSSGLTIYSNIVNNVTGSGVGISGGRDHNVHNNLFISCGFFAYSLDARDMTTYKSSDEAKTKTLNAYFTNEIWQEAFPELKGIHGNFNPANRFDPMFEGMPSNNRFVDNYGYFNRMNRITSYIGNYTFLYYDDEIINQANCEIVPISTENGNMKTYNSRRDPLIIYTDTLAVAEAAGYPIMTTEQFNEIGRIGIGVTSVHNPK